MTTTTVAARISQALSALSYVGGERADSRSEALRQSHLDVLTALVVEYLPSGSGFDSGTTLDIPKSHPTKLVFNTSFHHMAYGVSDGWTDHTVTAQPTFSGLMLRVSGRNRNGIKDYIYETFDAALRRAADDEFVRRIMRESRDNNGFSC